MEDVSDYNTCDWQDRPYTTHIYFANRQNFRALRALSASLMYLLSKASQTYSHFSSAFMIRSIVCQARNQDADPGGRDTGVPQGATKKGHVCSQLWHHVITGLRKTQAMISKPITDSLTVSVARLQLRAKRAKFSLFWWEFSYPFATQRWKVSKSEGNKAMTTMTLLMLRKCRSSDGKLTTLRTTRDPGTAIREACGKSMI